MAEQRGWRERALGIKSFLLDVYRRYIEDRVPLAAAAIAFFILLSIVPLLLLIISVAAFFVTEAQAQAFATQLTDYLGPGVGSALESQILSVVRLRGVLTGLSLLLGFWAGSQIFVIIQSALNQVWDVEERRPFWVRRGLALIMVVVTAVLFLLAIAMHYVVGLIGRINIPINGEISEVSWIIGFLFGILIPGILAIAVFAIAYRYLSARKISWKLAIPSAIFAGVLWVVGLQVFSWYTGNIADYSVLYGSLGGLILLMLWLNYSGQIFLIGAEFASVYHKRRVESGKSTVEWTGDE